MIKLSKKVTFVLLVLSVVALVISIRNLDWSSLEQNNYKIFLAPSGCLALCIYYFIYYVKLVKQDS
jgi:predicted lysophospholipase L1 biosynthesis ABC-type transport system permease subunit